MAQKNDWRRYLHLSTIAIGVIGIFIVFGFAVILNGAISNTEKLVLDEIDSVGSVLTDLEQILGKGEAELLLMNATISQADESFSSFEGSLSSAGNAMKNLGSTLKLVNFYGFGFADEGKEIEETGDQLIETGKSIGELSGSLSSQSENIGGMALEMGEIRKTIAYERDALDDTKVKIEGTFETVSFSVLLLSLALIMLFVMTIMRSLADLV